VGGTFPNELSRYDAKKNKLSVTVIALAKLRKILGGLSYRVMGVAEDGAVIVEVVDNESGTANEKLTPNGGVIIGGKLKIVGGPALTGVYLVASGSPTITVKVTTRLVENNPGKIIAVIPDLPTGKSWKVQVRTQYAGSSTLLKDVRTIETDFTLST
jgi:hypothetical protein